MLFFLDNLLIPQESVSLQRVFHSIRFKVNKGWVKALTLFLCLYFSSHPQMKSIIRLSHIFPQQSNTQADAVKVLFFHYPFQHILSFFLRAVPFVKSSLIDSSKRPELYYSLSIHYLLHNMWDKCCTYCETAVAQYVSQLFHKCGTANKMAQI